MGRVDLRHAVTRRRGRRVIGTTKNRRTLMAAELSAFPPRLPADEYAHDDQARDGADDQVYALEDYEEEAPSGRRRSGLVVVAAVLGLAVLGTAGAFAYRAMFGSSMLPSLPPIIRADDEPNKIVPKPKANASDQADASATTSGEKLVPREEQPVDVPAPVNPAPRVVSTIPIFPDPNSGQAGVPNSAQAQVQAGVLAPGGTNFPAPPAAPVSPAPTVSAQPNTAASIWPPSQTTAPVPSNDAAPTAPTGSAGPKKVHTVIIRTDQMDAAANASSAPQSPPPTPAPAPARPAPPRAAAAQPAPRPAPAPELTQTRPCRSFHNRVTLHRLRRRLVCGPLWRVSTESNETAASEPAASGGGYAVQVTSQRSEADAQAEFRSLQAKFPTQLGSQRTHRPPCRSWRQRRLLPRAGRSLCVDGPSRCDVLRA